MHYFKNIAIGMVTACLFVGCNNNLLETIPNDRISSKIFWRTDDDAIAAANAVYTYLPSAETIFNWDGMSDIGHITLMWRDESLIERGTFNSTTPKVYDVWNSTYKSIQATNAFLANIDQVQPTDKQLIDRLKGEVKALRAYFYINLAFLYGDVPLVTSPLTIEESSNLTRTPVDEVWDFIEQEFNEAAALLPVIQNDEGRITKGAALALKARAMLYAGRFKKAAAAAKHVMELNVYSLYPSYEKLFSYEAENNDEIILDNQFVEGVRSNDAFGYLAPFSLEARGEVVPTSNALEGYQMKNGKDITDPTSGFDPLNPYRNRDPRLKYSIFVLGDRLPNGKVYDPRPKSGTGDAIGYSENSTPTGFNIKKYVNKEDLGQPFECGINIILMRYAEVLLTYAEAKIELGQIDQSVLDAINLVRGRPDVNMPPIEMSSQVDLRDLVRKERLRELAFEGLRYFDIRRWRIAEDIIPGIIYGMTYYSDEEGKLVTVSLSGFKKTFKSYLWPIPHREIELNPSLKQNPGW